MNYRCYQTILRVKHVYTNRESCEVLTGYLSLRTPVWRWLGEYVTLNKKFCSLLLKQEAVASQVTSKFSCLIAFIEKALIRSIIITLSINYTIKICIINNAIITNNYGAFQNLILLFKIPTGTRKNFFNIYRKVGHTNSKPSPDMSSSACTRTVCLEVRWPVFCSWQLIYIYCLG